MSHPPPETAPLLVVLLGPTASGKTALSLLLAERFHGEILSCDSVAVYRGMDLGAAKPTPEQRARVPHHLLDVAWPDQLYTAGDYSRDARCALAQITARGRLPIVSGGSGLYLRALLEGLFAGPQRSPALRERLRAAQQRRGPLWLHRLLERLDPASAARIHPHDQPKLIRALEVSIATRQPLSRALGTGARDPLTGYRILRLGLQPDRAALYSRINERAARMFAPRPNDSSPDAPRPGQLPTLLEETQALLARHQRSSQQPRPLSLDALGYRQAAAVLAGELSLRQAIAEAQQGHRNYAKRQLTWFRREPEVHWLYGFGDDPQIAEKACAAVAANLKQEL